MLLSDGLALCAQGKRGTTLLGQVTSFEASAADHAAAYPPPGATRVRRAAVGRVTGNVGHDLFLEGLSDLFAQQTLGGGPGFFDAVLLEAYWFHSAKSLLSAMADASSSWTSRWRACSSTRRLPPPPVRQRHIAALAASAGWAAVGRRRSS